MAFADQRPASWPNTSVPAVDAETISYGGGNHTLARASRAIYIGTAGNLNVTFRGGTTVVLSNLAAGTIYPISVTVVLQASSTAAGVALY